MIMKNILTTLLFVCILSSVNAQSIFGKWKSIDDETGKAKSIIEIYEKDRKVYGKIIEIINKDRANAVCDACKGDKKNQPILGMRIIEGLELEDDMYEGGTITNPENGKVYKCTLKLTEDSDTLRVRGYVAFFYKTQYWKRVE